MSWVKKQIVKAGRQEGRGREEAETAQGQTRGTAADEIPLAIV